MWFGTENGIDKCDGYNFFNYSHDPRDSLTLSDNQVTELKMVPLEIYGLPHKTV